ncbi:MAG: class I SAM-dependent methyltransferase [Humibacter sp.]
MIYQDPLAYLLGIEGSALLDAWAGDHDRAFVEDRIAEIRRLLADEKLRGRGVLAERVTAEVAYQEQAPDYDANAGGGLFELDEPVITEWLAHREVGVALDAACGTGRFARILADRGHTVIGVDGSPDMLERARERVPEGEFLLGSVDRLPLPDRSVDLVVCALALVHVSDLGPVFAEFARMLRPGGALLISDVHRELTAIGSGIKGLGPDGERRLAPAFRHPLGDYLRASLAAGLELRGCEEPALHWDDSPLPRPSAEIGDWPAWPWSLMAYVPEATRAVSGRPQLLLLHFAQPGS